MIPQKAARIFLICSAWILVLASAGKIATVIADWKNLAAADGVLGISYRTVFLSTGILEISIAAHLIIGARRLLQPLLLFAIGLSFLFYRTAQWAMDVKAPCGCFGSVTKLLPFETRYAEIIAMGISIIFVVGRALQLSHSLFSRSLIKRNSLS